MKRFPGCVAFLGLLACGSDDAPSPGTTSSSSGNPGSTSSVTGSLAASPFTAKSSVFLVDADGSVNLIMSDREGELCATIGAGTVRPGETLVLVQSLQGTGAGDYTIDDLYESTFFSKVPESCPSGPYSAFFPPDPGGKGNGIAARKTTPALHVTAHTDAVFQGTLSITFDDASTLSGPFDAKRCLFTQRGTYACP